MLVAIPKLSPKVALLIPGAAFLSDSAQRGAKESLRKLARLYLDLGGSDALCWRSDTPVEVILSDLAEKVEVLAERFILVGMPKMRNEYHGLRIEVKGVLIDGEYALDVLFIAEYYYVFWVEFLDKMKKAASPYYSMVRHILQAVHRLPFFPFNDFLNQHDLLWDGYLPEEGDSESEGYLKAANRNIARFKRHLALSSGEHSKGPTFGSLVRKVGREYIKVEDSLTRAQDKWVLNALALFKSALVDSNPPPSPEMFIQGDDSCCFSHFGVMTWDVTDETHEQWENWVSEAVGNDGPPTEHMRARGMGDLVRVKNYFTFLCHVEKFAAEGYDFLRKGGWRGR